MVTSEERLTNRIDQAMETRPTTIAILPMEATPIPVYTTRRTLSIKGMFTHPLRQVTRILNRLIPINNPFIPISSQSTRTRNQTLEVVTTAPRLKRAVRRLGALLAGQSAVNEVLISAQRLVHSEILRLWIGDFKVA